MFPIVPIPFWVEALIFALMPVGGFFGVLWVLSNLVFHRTLFHPAIKVWVRGEEYALKITGPIGWCVCEYAAGKDWEGFDYLSPPIWDWRKSRKAKFRIKNRSDKAILVTYASLYDWTTGTKTVLVPARKTVTIRTRVSTEGICFRGDLNGTISVH